MIPRHVYEPLLLSGEGLLALVALQNFKRLQLCQYCSVREAAILEVDLLDQGYAMGRAPRLYGLGPEDSVLAAGDRDLTCALEIGCDGEALQAPSTGRTLSEWTYSSESDSRDHRTSHPDLPIASTWRATGYQGLPQGLSGSEMTRYGCASTG